MKVLIIRLSAMGDIVHGLPVAAMLKERLPGLELSWMVEPAGIPLLEGNPAVDRVLVFPKKKWLQQLRSVSGMGATAAEARLFFAGLKKLQFDAAIDLQGLFKSSLLGFLSGANIRLGFKGTREGADRLLTHAFDSGDYFAYGTHVVDMNLRLADYACRLLLKESTPDDFLPGKSYINDPVRFPLPAPPVETLERMRALLDFGQAADSPIIALIPGTTWVTKIWPVDKWIALSRLLLEKTKGPLLLLGAASELEMNAAIALALGDRVLNLTGNTQITELLAIFQMTDIVIGADTGPLHLAAALGKPRVLSVFGSTPPERNGPYGTQCSTVSLKLDCQPCFKKICPLGTLACLKDLSPEFVFNRVPF